jgi:hypothetical protein
MRKGKTFKSFQGKLVTSCDNFIFKIISLVILIIKIKMSQHVTSFPWKDLKIVPFGMSQNFIYDPYLSRSGHDLSRVVTACHGISCDKGGVTHQQT